METIVETLETNELCAHEVNDGVKLEKGCITDNKKLICAICDKSYANRSGLWKHKKVCNKQTTLPPQQPPPSLPFNITEELVLTLIKQNTEMMEIIKNGTHNTNHSHNTTTNNSHNKAFNLNFFLNETCKNAMNLSDFVDSIKVELSDIERFAEVGYVEGISNIIRSNLKVLDVTERPVHCTDKKRETIYVKDEDKWEKEDENKNKLRMLIKRIENKNFRLLPAYREKYPGCQSSSSKFSDRYNKMMVEITGGPGKDDKEKHDKIIHLISKHIVVDK